MPKGPQGQKRPADAIARAVMVAQIATGEIEETVYDRSARKSAGGLARAAKLSHKTRQDISKAAAAARWKKEGNMSSQVERMKHAMFPSDGISVVNVKFFLGNDRSVTAEQLADQLDRADAQLRGKVAMRTTTLDGGLTVTSI